MMPLTDAEKAMEEAWEKEAQILAADLPDGALPLLFLPRLLTDRILPARSTKAREVIRQYRNVRVRLSTIDNEQLPYGATAKKLLIFFVTRACQERSREVQLGVSERELMSILGIARGGRAQSLLRQQIKRLAALTIEIHFEPNRKQKIIYRGVLFSKIKLSMDSPDEQLPLFNSSGLYATEIKFAHDFYESIIRYSSVPFRADMIREFSHPFALDLFLYFSIRLPNIKHGDLVELNSDQLIDQFAYKTKGFRVSHFMDSLETAVNSVLSVWSAASHCVSFDRRAKKLTMAYCGDLVALRKPQSGGW